MFVYENKYETFADDQKGMQPNNENENVIWNVRDR
jgi:hypothetical protein